MAEQETVGGEVEATSAPPPIVNTDGSGGIDEVRARVEDLLEQGQQQQAADLLHRQVEQPEGSWSLEEELWLLRRLAELRVALGDEEGALEAYEAAFGLDPRGREILVPYSHLLAEARRSEDGLRVIQAILLHHKRQLEPEDLAQVYCRMGQLHEQIGEHDKAQAAYEKALEQERSSSVALDGLSRVLSSLGNPMGIVQMRERQLRHLDGAEARSRALVALGDVWVHEFNDAGRAIDSYEQAVVEWPENAAALMRMAEVAREGEDWRRVSRAYFTLSRLAQDPQEEAEWLVRASIVARDELWEPEKALAGLRRALELDPTRLDAFKAVTAILVDTKDWASLKESYVHLIAANREREDADPKLLAVLWEKLGELYETHLEDTHEAIVAFHQASLLAPQDVDLHERVATLAETDPESLDAALAHLQAIRRLDPSRRDVLDRIGRVYLRKKQADPAYLVFRAIRYLGHPLDDKARSFVENLDSPYYKKKVDKLDLRTLKDWVFDEKVNPAISDVFALIKPALEEWTGESHRKYGLRRRDRVKLDDPLAFNNIYSHVGHALGYRDLPELWFKPEQQGIANGALVPEGLIVGEALMGEAREKHIAFAVAKELFLFLSPFYLARIRPFNDIQVFFMLGMAQVKPEYDRFQKDDTILSAQRTMQKRIKGDDLRKLSQAVDRIVQQGGDVNLAAWLEGVENTANRVGFLFCDDLQVVEDSLNHETQPMSQRPVADRMQDLVEYSLSERYMGLRERLGTRVG